MYLIEKIAINGGANLGLADSVNFDIPIPSQWVKTAYLKIAQRQGGVMNIIFQLWQTTAARGDAMNRANLIYKSLSRQITLTAGQGGEFGEILAGGPIHYCDRDAKTPDSKQCYVHCRLENQPAGTASDFDVQMILVDPWEGSH